MAEAKLNVPEKPKPPQIAVGDYLYLNVDDDKQVQFKNLMAYHAKTQRSMVDPAGYVFSDYDRDLIKYLAGQVLVGAFESIKSESLDVQNIQDLKDISSSGYYYLSKSSQYVEANMLDNKNGIVLILGTVFFYEIKNGVLSKQQTLKGGEKNE